MTCAATRSHLASRPHARAFVALGLVGILLGGASAAPGSVRAETAASEGTLTWRLDGRTPPGSLEVDAFRHARIDLAIPTGPGRPPTDPQIQLSCRNRVSGEAGEASLSVVGMGSASDAEDRLELAIATGDVIAGMPYPIDPLAMASKPSAIISQGAGRSVLGIPAAELRQRYRDTAAYMLTTAAHHYGVPYGDGALDCTLSASASDRTWGSQGFSIEFGRGAPRGPYPRDHRGVPAGERTWWVADPGSLPSSLRDDLVGAADDPRTAGPLTSTGAALIRRWDDGSAVGPWIEVALDVVATSRENPVRASRALALVAVAANDALAAAYAALGASSDSSGPRPYEHTVVAAAVETVLRELYPGLATIIDEAVAQSAMARELGGWATPRQAEAADAVGRWAANLVLQRAKGDGSSADWQGSVPARADRWTSALDTDAPPLEPLAGTWLPWNIEHGAALRPAEPPRPGDERFERELQEVIAVSAGLSAAQEQIASQWQDKDGSFTPAGHWTAVALRLARREGWSSARAAVLFAALATAQADAFIAAFDSKYAYWAIRPITVIRASEPDWRPYIDTPHFPSYVSGHAATSGAAGAALSGFFPHHADELAACARQAATSRLFGGIHFRVENEVGLAMGERAAEAALMKVHLPGVLPHPPRAADAVGCLWQGA